MNEIARIKNEVRLKQWAEKVAPTVLPKTQLGKAFEYAFKRREYLGNYFKNGDCAISNNAAENAIRPFTVGRKNWLFSDTPNGAKASADIYSIVETAKANRLDVFKYFELLLTVRFRKINRVNAIIAKFLTILKLQPNMATLRSDLTQAVK